MIFGDSACPDCQRLTSGNCGKHVPPDPALVERARKIVAAGAWGGGSESLVQAVAAFAAEVAEERTCELKRWVDDLQSGMYVNCVYCGHRYGPGETTPVTMADALKVHVEQCPKHPMSALKARETWLREALIALAEKIGAMPTRLEPDAHDALCESEYIAPAGDTPCDCQHRKDIVRAALAELTG